MAGKSIFTRKVDLLWLVFFAIHLVVMFNVDLYPLWPEPLRPQYMTDLRTWYITTYRDQFFVQPPAWFTAFTWLELVYHVPLCLWAIPALINDDPRIPVQLVIYAVETGITTLTCIADYNSWPTTTQAEKNELHKLYMPYFGVSVIMGLDMILRLDKIVKGPARVAGTSSTKKGQ